jgi:hypothetical protein
MTKNYVEIKYRRKIFKLRAEEIHKVFRTKQRKCPTIPPFFSDFKNVH